MSDGYGRLAGDDDRRQLGDVLSEAFAFPPATAAGWFDYAGHENLRVFRSAGAVAGGLVLIPMGQFWGGRPVRACGVAGVGVAAAERGRGIGTRMMADALREMRESGYALSILYPATQPIYRRVGYEQAGSRFEITGRLDALPAGGRELPIRNLAPDDLPAVQRAYQEVAKGRAGALDRGPYIWHRVQRPRAFPAYGYVIGAPDEVEGYVFLARPLKPNFRSDVVVIDMAALSPRAWRRLATFFVDQASMSVELTWYGGHDDPLLLLLDEQTFTATAKEAWMIRIVDVERALATRGYLPHLAGEVDLDVADELFPENAGRWTLEVSGGEARVRRGGAGTLRCDARALASMYSGFRSAAALAALGLVDGTPEALATATAIFSGPSPAMGEIF